MNNIINVKDLSVRYGKYEVLSHISFAVGKGDYISIVGPNGAGKSTLVKAILNLVEKSGGEIIINNRNIGYLPQKTYSNDKAFPATVKEIISTGLLGTKKFPMVINASDREKINKVIEKLHIKELEDRRIGLLSGGQQQRVLLARAIVNNPAILILDEPTSALDPEFKKEFYEILGHLNKDEGVTIILITHDVSGLEKYSHKILYIDRKIIFYGDSKTYIKNAVFKGDDAHE